MIKVLHEILQNFMKEGLKSKIKFKKNRGNGLDLLRENTSMRLEPLAPTGSEKHKMTTAQIDISNLKKIYNLLMNKFINPSLDLVPKTPLDQIKQLDFKKQQEVLKFLMPNMFCKKNSNRKMANCIEITPTATIKPLKQEKLRIGWSGQKTKKLLNPQVEKAKPPTDIASAFFEFPEVDQTLHYRPQFETLNRAFYDVQLEKPKTTSKSHGLPLKPSKKVVTAPKIQVKTLKNKKAKKSISSHHNPATLTEGFPNYGSKEHKDQSARKQLNLVDKPIDCNKTDDKNSIMGNISKSSVSPLDFPPPKKLSSNKSEIDNSVISYGDDVINIFKDGINAKIIANGQLEQGSGNVNSNELFERKGDKEDFPLQSETIREYEVDTSSDNVNPKENATKEMDPCRTMSSFNISCTKTENRPFDLLGTNINTLEPNCTKTKTPNKNTKNNIESDICEKKSEQESINKSMNCFKRAKTLEAQKVATVDITLEQDKNKLTKELKEKSASDILPKENNTYEKYNVIENSVKFSDRLKIGSTDNKPTQKVCTETTKNKTEKRGLIESNYTNLTNNLFMGNFQKDTCKINEVLQKKKDAVSKLASVQHLQQKVPLKPISSNTTKLNLIDEKKFVPKIDENHSANSDNKGNKVIDKVEQLTTQKTSNLKHNNKTETTSKLNTNLLLKSGGVQIINISGLTKRSNTSVLKKDIESTLTENSSGKLKEDHIGNSKNTIKNKSISKSTKIYPVVPSSWGKQRTDKILQNVSAETETLVSNRRKIPNSKFKLKKGISLFHKLKVEDDCFKNQNKSNSAKNKYSKEPGKYSKAIPVAFRFNSFNPKTKIKHKTTAKNLKKFLSQPLTKIKKEVKLESYNKDYGKTNDQNIQEKGIAPMKLVKPTDGVGKTQSASKIASLIDKKNLPSFVKHRKLHSKKPAENASFNLRLYGEPAKSKTLSDIRLLKSVQVITQKVTSGVKPRLFKSMSPGRKITLEKYSGQLPKSNTIGLTNKVQTRNLFTIENRSNMMLNYLIKRFASLAANYEMINQLNTKNGNNKKVQIKQNFREANEQKDINDNTRFNKNNRNSDKKNKTSLTVIEPLSQKRDYSLEVLYKRKGATNEPSLETSLEMDNRARCPMQCSGVINKSPSVLSSTYFEIAKNKKDNTMKTNFKLNSSNGNALITDHFNKNKKTVVVSKDSKIGGISRPGNEPKQLSYGRETSYLGTNTQLFNNTRKSIAEDSQSKSPVVTRTRKISPDSSLKIDSKQSAEKHLQSNKDNRVSSNTVLDINKNKMIESQNVNTTTSGLEYKYTLGTRTVSEKPKRWKSKSDRLNYKKPRILTKTYKENPYSYFKRTVIKRPNQGSHTLEKFSITDLHSFKTNNSDFKKGYLESNFNKKYNLEANQNNNNNKILNPTARKMLNLYQNEASKGKQTKVSDKGKKKLDVMNKSSTDCNFKDFSSSNVLSNIKALKLIPVQKKIIDNKNLNYTPEKVNPSLVKKYLNISKQTKNRSGFVSPVVKNNTALEETGNVDKFKNKQNFEHPSHEQNIQDNTKTLAHPQVSSILLPGFKHTNLKSVKTKYISPQSESKEKTEPSEGNESFQGCPKPGQAQSRNTVHNNKVQDSPLPQKIILTPNIDLPHNILARSFETSKRTHYNLTKQNEKIENDREQDLNINRPLNHTDQQEIKIVPHKQEEQFGTINSKICKIQDPSKQSLTTITGINKNNKATRLLKINKNVTNKIVSTDTPIKVEILSGRSVKKEVSNESTLKPEHLPQNIKEIKTQFLQDQGNTSAAPRSYDENPMLPQKILDCNNILGTVPIIKKLDNKNEQLQSSSEFNIKTKYQDDSTAIRNVKGEKTTAKSKQPKLIRIPQLLKNLKQTNLSQLEASNANLNNTEPSLAYNDSKITVENELRKITGSVLISTESAKENRESKLVKNDYKIKHDLKVPNKLLDPSNKQDMKHGKNILSKLTNLNESINHGEFFQAKGESSSTLNLASQNNFIPSNAKQTKYNSFQKKSLHQGLVKSLKLIKSADSLRQNNQIPVSSFHKTISSFKSPSKNVDLTDNIKNIPNSPHSSLKSFSLNPREICEMENKIKMSNYSFRELVKSQNLKRREQNKSKPEKMAQSFDFLTKKTSLKEMKKANHDLQVLDFTNQSFDFLTKKTSLKEMKKTNHDLQVLQNATNGSLKNILSKSTPVINPDLMKPLKNKHSNIKHSLEVLGSKKDTTFDKGIALLRMGQPSFIKSFRPARKTTMINNSQ